MARFCLAVLISLAVIGISLGAHTQLIVHYSPHCPKCQDFITKQVGPAVEALGGVYNSHLDVQLTPYGNTKTEWIDGKGLQFDCEYEKECVALKAHSCGVTIFPHKESFAYLVCSMNSLSQKFGTQGCQKCVENLGIDFEAIKKCALSWEGEVLLAANGIDKNSLSPPLTEHPWILINDKYHKDLADGMKIDMLATLCKMWKGEKHEHGLPKACDGKV